MASKQLISWEINAGPYPGILFGLRNYVYPPFIEDEGEVEYTTTDLVLYVPFFMVIFTMFHAKSNKS